MQHPSPVSKIALLYNLGYSIKIHAIIASFGSGRIYPTVFNRTVTDTLGVKMVIKRGFLVALFLGVALCSGSQTADKAPDFSLKTTTGKTVKLSDCLGKVVIVNFWASWCPPCRAEIPDFVTVYKNYQDKGLEIIGIAVSSSASQIQKMIQDYGITYPVVISDGKVEAAYGGVTAVPTTFLIDKKGNIVKKHIGALDKKTLEGLIKNLL